MELPALDVLFPPACAGCGDRPAPGSFCRTCASALEPLPAPACPRCAAPGPADLCGACLHDPPPFDRLVAAFLHGGPVADALHRLKYRGRREVAPALGRILAGRFAGLLAGAAVIAPIPLHRARRGDRRYDQAALLARAIARCARRPFRADLLTRVRPTLAQVGQGRAARLRNLEGAFVCRPAAGLSVALVDDVVTTAATAAAAARAAREAGAREVLVVAVSRAE